MLGLRWAFALWRPADRQVQDGTFDWIWPAAEKAGLPVALLAGDFLPKFRWIAERHPHLKLIIDHCGLKSRRPRTTRRWSISTSCCRWPNCPTSR